MSVIRKYNSGEFCWADLGTTNTLAAKKFYQSIFDWTAKDFPMGPGDEKYSMLRVRGKDACALYPMPDEQKKAKKSPFWLPYIAVKSADAIVKKAKAAGAKICMGPLDVMDQGRQAVIADPTGALFAVWQARKHPGAGLDDTPGTVCWHDLSTAKTSVAGKFYTKVFGWKLGGEDVDGHAYHLFKLGKESVGGMWPDAMKKLPPSWMTHFQVASCAKTVAKARRLGARALMGTTHVPGYCRFAILRDPQGAAFGIIEFDR